MYLKAISCQMVSDQFINSCIERATFNVTCLTKLNFKQEITKWYEIIIKYSVFENLIKIESNIILNCSCINNFIVYENLTAINLKHLNYIIPPLDYSYFKAVKFHNNTILTMPAHFYSIKKILAL